MRLLHLGETRFADTPYAQYRLKAHATALLRARLAFSAIPQPSLPKELQASAFPPKLFLQIPEGGPASSTPPAVGTEQVLQALLWQDKASVGDCLRILTAEQLQQLGLSPDACPSLALQQSLPRASLANPPSSTPCKSEGGSTPATSSPAPTSRAAGAAALSLPSAPPDAATSDIDALRRQLDEAIAKAGGASSLSPEFLKSLSTAASSAASAASKLSSSAAHRVVQDRKAQFLSMLAEDLRDGNVVLFLGAGFFAPAGLPSWLGLMEQLLRECTGLEEAVRASLLGKVKEGGAANFEMAAQCLEDRLGKREFETKLFDSLSYVPSKHERKMKRCFALLRLLPFRSILTTNFTRAFKGVDFSLVPGDSEEKGSRHIPQAKLADFLSLKPPHLAVDTAQSLVNKTTPGRDQLLLRCAYDTRDSPSTPQPPLDASLDAPVLHIHGSLKAVSTRASYRNLLYGTKVLPFLRALSASTRYLFLGYSLSDSYFVEILQETLSLLKVETKDEKRGGFLGDKEALQGATRLGYVFSFCPPSDPQAEATLSSLEYDLTHLGLCRIPTTDPNLELRKLVEQVSPRVLYASAFRGRRVLVYEGLYARALPRSGFEEAALALAALAYAAVAQGATFGETEARKAGEAQFKEAELLFREKRDDYNGLLAALQRFGGERPPLTSRPFQQLPLPGDGEIRVCFTLHDALEALGEPASWDALLCDWDLVRSAAEAAARPFSPVGRGAAAREAAAPPSALSPLLAKRIPKLAFSSLVNRHGAGGGSAPAAEGAGAQAGEGRSKDRLTARTLGFLDLCDSKERLLKALGDLLQASPRRSRE